MEIISDFYIFMFVLNLHVQEEEEGVVADDLVMSLTE
jgi:hypothetical protein